MTKAKELLKKPFAVQLVCGLRRWPALVEAFGFRQPRQRGSHHIFVHPNTRELVNIQDVTGMTKPYQVRQFLKLVERYNLRLGGRE